MAQPQQGNQPLSSKEANLFRQVVKFYETKQFKKGLKTADQILKKVPDHGETLAMKGLTLNCMERKEEAYELVRKGLKSDLKSHVCWHVYGLLYRSDRNYREAIKCYLNALRIDKDNVQILRDLAQLQIQMRDIQEFVETRQRLLHLKPGNRNHWISFAVAHHLNKSYDIAVRVIEAYENTLEEVPAAEAYEHGEMLLYKVMILEEGSMFEDALRELTANKDKIRDDASMKEMQASILLKVGRNSEAEAMYRVLLDRTPDNYGYHEGLQQSKGVLAATAGRASEEQYMELDALYSQLVERYPDSAACRRIPLDYKQDDVFRAAADAYVRPYISKGIPSLFSDLRSLYREKEKGKVLGELFETYSAALAAHGCLPATLGPPDESTSDAQRHHIGDPTTVTNMNGHKSVEQAWVLHYLAQHYNNLGNTHKALQAIDQAIGLEADIVELYCVKSKILNKAGNLKGASLCADKARDMDLADRYLNSMAVKQLFRSGNIDKAERTAALFTRDGDQVNNLFDMQHMWYELECGKAHLRKKQYGKALKMFLAISKHFGDIQEDQFDFHSYCVRKMTLRAYIRMLRMEDALYNHPFFAQAAVGAIQCYLDLADRPNLVKKEQEDSAIANMSPEERRKHRARKKKEAKRAAEADLKAAREAEKAAKEQESKNETAGKKKGTAHRDKDPDPDGRLLAAVADPISEATKLVEMLKEHAPKKLCTNIAAFEVYMRKRKWLLALSAVQRALDEAGPESADVHKMIIKFCHEAQNLLPEQNVVHNIVREAIEKVLGGQNVMEYNDQFCKRQCKSLPQLASAAEMMVYLNDSRRAQAAAFLLEGIQQNDWSLPPTHEVCVAVDRLVSEKFSGTDAAAAWKKHCALMFPWSEYFEGRYSLEVLPPYMNGNASADL